MTSPVGPYLVPVKTGNKMRWDCEKSGCFNQKCRPKIDVFADCFPGAIAFGDVDAICEINGQCLYLEWKSIQAPLQKGQEITYTSLAKRGDFVLVVCGNAETMAVSSFQYFSRHGRRNWTDGDLAAVKAIIRWWVAFATFGDPRFEFPTANPMAVPLPPITVSRVVSVTRKHLTEPEIEQVIEALRG